MRRKMKRIWILCFVIILMWAMTGCDGGMESIKEDTQKREESVEEEEIQPIEATVEETLPPTATPEPEVTPAPTSTATPELTATPEPTIIPEPTAIPTPEPQESLPPKAVEYGDKVTISYEKTVYSGDVWEYACSQEFKVSTASKEFQGDSEEIIMENVEKAIGKTAGDTFTIWVEEEEGLHGYEYTIVDVKGENADIIEYGDKIFTSFVMRGQGVDTGDGYTIHTGEQVLRLTNTDAFMANAEGGYSVEGADYCIKELMGKGVGHSFDFVEEDYEWFHHYKYRIHGISKAVKYGDTIKAEVREVVLVPDESLCEKDKEASFIFRETGTELNIDEIIKGRMFFDRLMGKNVGDNVEIRFFSEGGHFAEATMYNIEVKTVQLGEKETEETDPMKALMLADEEEIVFIYDSCPYNGLHNNWGWIQETLAIFVEDTENHMTYEYYTDYYDDKFSLSYTYGLEQEYDSEGRVIKEINKRDEGGGMYYNITEYKYDAAGNCVESVEGYLNDDGTFQIYCITSFQYDENGICIEEKKDYNGGYDGLIEVIYYNEMKQMINKVSTYSDGRKYISEYDPTKPHYYCKTTRYDADGNVNVTVEDYEEEYGIDEWGFVRVPH
ncbi:MAG: hypothetical protein IKK33_17010 [Lachnospiraceae bacterium]|nr:hypothetical protein [Lachnospiraceae bacterium]